MIKIREIKAKTILSPSKLPASDWSINPYSGCSFGCMYCYVAAMGRWNHPEEEWESYVDVKVNAPEILKVELDKLEKKILKSSDSSCLTDQNDKAKDFGSIFFSSVTDPYQGAEAKYEITRKCLQVLIEFGYEGKIAIQTKSPLVTRDIDLLKKLKNVEVGFTITSLNDETSRFLEVMAPNISQRLEALEKLNKAQIKTYAFVGPMLPYLWKNELDFNKLLDKLEKTGIKKIWFEGINLNTKIRERLYKYLGENNSELIIDFEKSKNSDYRERIDKMVKRRLKGRRVKMGFEKVIWHGK